MRCRLLREGDITTLLQVAHEAQTGRVTKSTKASSIPSSSTSFSKTSRATILDGAGAVGRACKLEVASKLISKLTLKARHAHIPVYVPKVKPLPNRIPLKVVIDAFSGMPKKLAAHMDG